MDTTLVTMLKSLDEHEKGKSYEIDSETADKWVEAAIAEKANPSQLLDRKLADLQNTIEESQSKLVEKLATGVGVRIVRLEESNTGRQDGGRVESKVESVQVRHGLP